VIERPVAITMLFLATAVFGLVSLGKLPVDLLPEISYPTVTVRSSWPGAAPADVEDRISERVQEALSTLPKLVRSTSISRAETSDVVLEFEWNTPMTFAVQDVRDKLDGVFLPEGVQRPLILRYDPNLDPILRVGVGLPERLGAPSGDHARAQARDLMQLRWLAEHRLKRELEGQAGVAAVVVRGGLEEEIRVRVDPYKLAAHGLDPALVAQRLAQENLNASGGLIREGSTEYLVRTLNEFTSLSEIESLALTRRGAAVVRLSDVATVARDHAEREVVTRLGGEEAVEIAIYREAGANVVELAERVKRVLFGSDAQREHTARLEREGRAEERSSSWNEREQTDYLAWRYRKQARLELLSDQSVFIRDAIDDLKSSALGGAVLAIGVLWLFLRRIVPTLVVGIAIPVTVVATFAPMYLADVSLNIMSLGGLALGIGMLVDTSIVVLESIERARSAGLPLRESAARGTSEVMGAVIASILTTVAVFLPIVFVEGIAGQIFGDQAVTVVASQFISLFVGVLFIPMLISRPWLAGDRPGVQPGDRPARVWQGLQRTWDDFAPGLLATLWRALVQALSLLLRALAGLVAGVAMLCGWLTRPLAHGFDRLWRSCESLYARCASGALRHAWLVVGAVLLLSGLTWVRSRHLGVDLLPEIHQGEFTLHVALEVGYPLEQTDAVLSEIDREVRSIPGVAVTALTVGVEKDTLSREIEGKHTARLTVKVDGGARDFEHEEALLARIRALVAAQPAVRSVDVSRPTPFALEAPVTVEILGRDLERMERVAREVYERVAALEGLTDVRTSVRPGNPEVRVTFDRDKLLEYGLDLAAVANLVRDQVLGRVSTRFDEGEEKIDVRVIGDETVLSDLERVLGLVVNPASNRPVELKSIAAVSRQQGPAEIRRIGNLRAIVVTAAGTGGDLGGLSRGIQTSLADLEKPVDVSVELGGQKREMDLAQKYLRGALLLAIFLVYVVMACQFESLLHPLVIMASVPLAAVGVVLGLDALDVPLSVTVFLGLILLAGIVVNNAIVLIDRINQRRAAGHPLRDSVLEACGARLRPIMMTSSTTILGLLPLTGWLDGLPLLGLLSGGGAGAELRAPMAITVVFGMTVSTALTLIVIPVLYYLVSLPLERRATRAEAAP
jgi:HAE1 family hydrophobic/amphiphilic exporter-1